MTNPYSKRIAILVLGCFLGISAMAESPTNITSLVSTPNTPDSTRLLQLDSVQVINQQIETTKSTVTLELKGSYQGNTCGAKEVALWTKDLDSETDFTKHMRIRKFELNLAYIERATGPIVLGTRACATFSAKTPFTTELQFVEYRGSAGWSTEYNYHMTVLKNLSEQQHYTLSVRWDPSAEEWIAALIEN